MQYSVRGERGEGGRGGGEGGRGEGGGGGEATRILVLPSHAQPKSIGGGETSPPDLGAHFGVHTEAPPPPPPHPRGGLEGWGSVGRGLRGGE